MFIKLHTRDRYAEKDHPIVVPIMIKARQIVSVRPYLERDSEGEVLTNSLVEVEWARPIFATESVAQIMELIARVDQ
jgi:hypothetical protein